MLESELPICRIQVTSEQSEGVKVEEEVVVYIKDFPKVIKRLDELERETGDVRFKVRTLPHQSR